MNSKFSMVKSVVVAAALAAGVSAIARADDSSMSRLGGDSYSYFNGANPAKTGNPVADQSPSAWRQSHPNGVPESQFQALSGFGQAWKPAPVLDMGPSTWQANHSNGLSERELQALSSEAPAWHQPGQPATSALASTNGGTTNTPTASGEPFGARIARFFHVTPANQAAPVN